MYVTVSSQQFLRIVDFSTRVSQFLNIIERLTDKEHSFKPKELRYELVYINGIVIWVVSPCTSVNRCQTLGGDE
jgi:hypothetical protein